MRLFDDAGRDDNARVIEGTVQAESYNLDVRAYVVLVIELATADVLTAHGPYPDFVDALRWAERYEKEQNIGLPSDDPGVKGIVKALYFDDQ